MKRPMNIFWQPWKRWFENATAPEIKLTTTSPQIPIQRNITPRDIREARRSRRVP